MKVQRGIIFTPKTPTLEALALMRRSRVGCLPVVENEQLVGIVTAYDFLSLSAEIIEGQLRDADAPASACPAA